jgi:hypothetical protein
VGVREVIFGWTTLHEGNWGALGKRRASPGALQPDRIRLQEAATGGAWEGDNFLIGRGPTADLRLPESSVSRSHAEVQYDQGGWWLRDLNSTFGTFLNGKRLPAGVRTRIAAGDELQFGRASLLVRGFVVGSAEGWDGCDHPPSMLKSLKDVNWSDPHLNRRLRRWAIACLTTGGQLGPDAPQEVRAALSLLWQDVDDVEEVERRREQLFRSLQGSTSHPLQRSLLVLLSPNPSYREYCIASSYDAHPDERRARLAVNADLLRCALGNPWRPLPNVPQWVRANGDVMALIAAIEREGTFDAMPILGDALEEAGCSDSGLLAHLRSNVHCLGCCHALDVLGL